MADDINVNAIADVLNKKIDLPVGINQSNIDYVIKSKYPTADDPTWYRVYKSGWVEQGGRINGTSTITVTLSKQMVDTNYSVMISGIENGTGSATITVKFMGARNLTTTTFQYELSSSYQNAVWEVKGMKASE